MTIVSSFHSTFPWIFLFILTFNDQILSDPIFLSTIVPETCHTTGNSKQISNYVESRHRSLIPLVYL